MSAATDFPAAGYMATPERACLRCKHREGGYWSEPTCGRLRTVYGFDPVRGTGVVNRVLCEDARINLHGRCGPQGVFWEAV